MVCQPGDLSSYGGCRCCRSLSASLWWICHRRVSVASCAVVVMREVPRGPRLWAEPGTCYRVDSRRQGPGGRSQAPQGAIVTLPNQDTRHRENRRPTVTTPILHRELTPPHTQTRVQEYSLSNVVNRGALIGVAISVCGWTRQPLGQPLPRHASARHVGLAETVTPPGTVVVRGAMGFAPLAALAK